MDGGSPVRPLTISARNAVAATGMSWTWCRRFAAAKGVPIFRIGERKQLIDGAALFAAIARHEQEQQQQPQPELTLEQERARLLAELGFEAAP